MENVVDRLKCQLPTSILDGVEKVIQCQKKAQEKWEKQSEAYAKFAIYQDCPREDEQKIMEEAGAKFIGSGTYRNAYKWDGCVVKLPHSEVQRKVNEEEAKVWERLTTGEKQFFAPVDQVGDDYSYITMPYAKRKTLSDRNRAIKTIQERARSSEGLYIPDLHDGNVGFIDDKPKVIDYQHMAFTIVGMRK